MTPTREHFCKLERTEAKQAKLSNPFIIRVNDCCLENRKREIYSFENYSQCVLVLQYSFHVDIFILEAEYEMDPRLLWTKFTVGWLEFNRQ